MRDRRARHPARCRAAGRSGTGSRRPVGCGVPPAEWSRLADEIDAIHHCAANVNMVLPYEVLRPANVGGTQEILRLALTGRRKALHYASTLSVLVATDHRGAELLEDDDLAAT